MRGANDFLLGTRSSTSARGRREAGLEGSAGERGTSRARRRDGRERVGTGDRAPGASGGETALRGGRASRKHFSKIETARAPREGDASHLEARARVLCGEARDANRTRVSARRRASGAVVRRGRRPRGVEKYRSSHTPAGRRASPARSNDTQRETLGLPSGPGGRFFSAARRRGVAM